MFTDGSDKGKILANWLHCSCVMSEVLHAVYVNCCIRRTRFTVEQCLFTSPYDTDINSLYTCRGLLVRIEVQTIHCLSHLIHSTTCDIIHPTPDVLAALQSDASDACPSTHGQP